MSKNEETTELSKRWSYEDYNERLGRKIEITTTEADPGLNHSISHQKIDLSQTIILGNRKQTK